jgi:hypothetical protein
MSGFSGTGINPEHVKAEKRLADEILAERILDKLDDLVFPLRKDRIEVICQEMNDGR